MDLLKIDSIAEISSDAEAKELLRILNRFSQTMNSQGYPIKAYGKQCVSQLARLDKRKKQSIIDNFSKFVDICDAAISEGIALKDTPAMLRYALKLLNKYCPEDFYASLAASDIVEVYDENHVQIFRNINFFEITSYSLVDLVSFEWPDLYYRSSIITKKIFDCVDASLRSQENIIKMDVESHLIKELRSDSVQMCEVNFRYMSPVFSLQGRRSGYVVSCTAKDKTNLVDCQKIDFI